jgi:urease accessory protein
MPTAQPRARGELRLSVKAWAGKTVIRTLRQSGSTKALFPRSGAGPMQAVMINTAGGVTGGDQYSIAARAEPGTHLTLTTQAAERAYRAQPGEIGCITTRLNITDKARLNWLPQETILFQGCALHRTLSVEMAQDAKVLLAEPLVFGRAAMGETLNNATFHDRIEIRRNGALLFLDALRLEGDIAAHLARPAVANGAGAMVTLVYVAKDAEAHLDPLRDLLPDTAGASLLRPDVLVLRALAPDSFVLRQSLVPALNRLTANHLPRCWMI